MLGNANHRAAECTVKTDEETKRGQRGHLERNVSGDKHKQLRVENNTEVIFGPTPATVEYDVRSSCTSYLSRSSAKKKKKKKKRVGGGGVAPKGVPTGLHRCRHHTVGKIRLTVVQLRFLLVSPLCEAVGEQRNTNTPSDFGW